MGPSAPTILLFDIDGTILLSGGAGRRAFAQAFVEVVGDAAGVERFSFEGMTDRGIARRGLGELGREADDALIAQLITHYLRALAEELPRSDYRILPGVMPLLVRLRALTGVALGLGTGNVRAGAEAKLRHGGLWEHFGFGGFGCDHEERGELLAHGQARGAAWLGAKAGDFRTIVLGDTVRDVAAAKHIGALCIGVCTGGGTADELRAAGAELVVEDLTRGEVTEFMLA